MGTAEALAFFLIKWVGFLFNLGLDLLTFLVGLVPKPFVQIAASRVPRLPILETSARVVFPSMDLSEFRSGNILSPWLWTLGFWFDVWFESRTPPLPGSLAALVPATAANMQLLANLLPLMQVLVFISSGLMALWIVMLPLKLLGADLGIFETIGIGAGGRPTNAPGAIRFSRGQKHFQRRLQGKVATGTGRTNVKRESALGIPSGASNPENIN